MAPRMPTIADRDRDAWVHAQGYRVLRFWNNEVLGNLDGVLRVIADAATTGATPPPGPLPQGEGEKDTSPPPLEGGGRGEGSGPGKPP